MKIKKIDKELFPALGGQKPKGESPRDYVRTESKKMNIAEDIDDAVKRYDDIISEYCENESHSPSFAEDTLPDREVSEVFFKDNGLFYDKDPICFDYFNHLMQKKKENVNNAKLPWGYHKRIDDLWSSVRTVRNGTGIYRLKEPLKNFGQALIAALITYICYVLMDKGILVLIAWGAFFIAGAITLILLGASFISIFGSGASFDDKKKLERDFLNALRFVRFRALWYQQMTGEDAVPAYLIEAEKAIFDTVKPVKKVLKKRLCIRIGYEADVEAKLENPACGNVTPVIKLSVSKADAKNAVIKADAAREANDYATAAKNYLKACKGGYDDFLRDALSMALKNADNEGEDRVKILNDVMRFYDRTHRENILDNDMIKTIYEYMSYSYQKEIDEEIGDFLRLYDPVYASIYKTDLRPKVEKAGYYYRKLAEMGDEENRRLLVKASVLLADNSRELTEALKWMKELRESDDFDDREMFEGLTDAVYNTIEQIQKNESEEKYLSALIEGAEIGIDICKLNLAICYYDNGEYYKAYLWINQTVMEFTCHGFPDEKYKKWFNETKKTITDAYLKR